MYLNVERYLEILEKTKLTQEEFIFLYLIFRKKYEAIKTYKRIYPTDDGSMIGEKGKQFLIEKGYLVHSGDGTKPSDYEITEKFTRLYLSNIFNAADELIDAYPGFIKINGVPQTLINMDRYQFAIKYGERIDHSIDEHLEILKDVKFGRDHDLIRVGIDMFLGAQMWEKLREIRLKRQQVKEVIEDKSF